MKLESIDINKAIADVKRLLEKEKDLSPALEAGIKVILILVELLVDRLGLNSRNSSKPPSSDPNRKRIRKPSGPRKPGGQKGHNGTTLQKTDNPDIIRTLKVDRKKLPAGDYRDVGYESRQVVDLDISKIVTEYRAQVLMDENGRRHVADFPENVTRPVQYGIGVKAHCVYMSQYQLIPYGRVEEMFSDQTSIPISAGTVFNFNEDAYNRLETFEESTKLKLTESPVVHSDETGININGKGLWLHCASNDLWTLFYLIRYH